MITVTRNCMHPPEAQTAPARRYDTATDYYRDVAVVASESGKWGSLRLYKTQEKSNDLSFVAFARHTLAVELSGTARHLSIFDSKTEEGRTSINDVCQLPTGLSARFAWQTIGETQSSLVVEFDDSLFVTFCPEFVTESFFAGHLLPRNYGPQPGISSLVHLLARELDVGTSRGQLFAESIIRLLAIEMSQCAWTRRPLSSSSAGVADRKIRLVLDYIECHLNHDISLQDLTRVSGLNSTHLINCFKKQVGATPYAHVLNRRIQQAVHLLRNSDMPIVEIALETGFLDQQQMTHLFRRRLGRTPGSFRE